MDIKSHKLNSPGLRIQIVTDSNQMILYVFKSEKCGKGSDGTVFLNIKWYNKIHIGDCIAMDGGYNLYIKKFKVVYMLEKNFLINILYIL